MAREWERGTLEALFVTPVRPVEVLLAKIIPYFCGRHDGTGDYVCWPRCFLFAVPLQGSLAALLAGADAVHRSCRLGIGLLISAVTRNQFLASQIAHPGEFPYPAMMLSGFVFDLRNVPAIGEYRRPRHPGDVFHGAGQDRCSWRATYWPLILKDCAILAAYAAPPCCCWWAG